MVSADVGRCGTACASSRHKEEEEGGGERGR